MNTIVSIIVAIIASGALNVLLNRLFAKRDKNKGNDRATRLIMKDRLRFLCQHYIGQGWIYEDELEDLFVMYESYHDDVGGNGYLKNRMEIIKNLEVRGIGVK